MSALTDDDQEGELLLKILVVGPKKAGKSVFCYKYCHDIFYADGQYVQTLGVDYHLKRLLRQNREIAVQFWDIAGQETTYNAHRTYFKNANAAIVMFDMTEKNSFPYCTKWKKSLMENTKLLDGSPLPCLLIANKSDLSEHRAFSREEIAEYASQENYTHHIETSAKKNTNLSAAVSFLVDEIMDNQIVGKIPEPQIFPSSKKKYRCCPI